MCDANRHCLHATDFLLSALIIASGLIEVLLGSAHDRDESDARNHDVTIDSATVVTFPGQRWVGDVA